MPITRRTAFIMGFMFLAYGFGNLILAYPDFTFPVIVFCLIFISGGIGIINSYALSHPKRSVEKIVGLVSSGCFSIFLALVTLQDGDWSSNIAFVPQYYVNIVGRLFTGAISIFVFWIFIRLLLGKNDNASDAA